MKKSRRRRHTEETARPDDSLRLDPENRLCPQFDATGIRMFPVASWDEMGRQVLDDFCQEHIE